MNIGTLWIHYKNIILVGLSSVVFFGCVAKKTVPKASTSIPSELGKNDTVPNAPTVTSPAYNPFTTGASQFNISGVCATDNMVSITGPSLQAAKCVNNAYSFVVKESTDATYTYYLAQKSPSGIVSAKTSFVWTRSQTVSPVVITSPPSSPYLSNVGTLNIAGTCTPGMAITVAGDYTGTANCDANSAFTFAVTETADGTYNFGVVQTDTLASLSSATFSLIWTLDKTAPLAPTLVSPVVSPHTSTSSSVTVSVACDDGNTVTVTGDKQATGVCSASAFTFSDTRAAFGTYNYSFSQTDLAGNASPALAFQWNYVATFVPPITITGPAYNDLATPKTKYVSNGGTLVLNGTCLTGYSIELTGAATQTATCTALGTFQFNLSKSADVTDGTYSFLMLQRDPNNSTPSASVQYIWNRDITSPQMVSLISPPVSPHIGATLAVVVGCDTEDSITVNGVNATDAFTYSATGTCVASQFTFVDTTQVTDGTVTYSIVESDLAANTSATYSFVWIRDTLVPAAPSLVFAPVSPVSPISPSRSDSVIISGSCVANHTVHLSGDVQSVEVTGGLLHQLCSGGDTYSFTVDKTNDPDPLLDPYPVKTYNFQVHQVNPNNNLNSAFGTGSWSRDKLVLIPTISIPTTGTFVSSGSIDIQGACETGASVNFYFNSGFDQTVTCANSSYAFAKNVVTVGTYTYSVNQVDLPGNISANSVDQVWLVNSGIPVNPTIILPSAVPNPYISSGTNLYLTGNCVTGDTVTISGSGNVSIPADLGNGGIQTASHSCTGSSYTYYINKPVTEGTFTLNVKQNFMGVDSATESRNWLRDATAPVVSVGSSPNGRTLGVVFPTPSPTPLVANSNLVYNPQISFSGTDVTNITYRCKLNGGAYASCTSPKTFYSSNTAALVALPSPSPSPLLTEGSFQSFYVEATDQASNVTIEQINWFQAAYKSIATYHFNNNKTDNSAYGASTLVASAGSVTFSTGTNAKMGNATSGTYGAYFNGSASLTTGTTNSVLNLGNTAKNTIEAFVKFVGLPNATNTYMIIAAKNGGATDYGWEFGIKYRNSTSFRYFFKATTDKNVAPTQICTLSINNSSVQNLWKHYAVVVTGNVVDLYLDGVKQSLSNSAPCTSAGLPTNAALSLTNAPLVIGDSSVTYSPAYLKLNGYIDEFRWSRVLRYTGASFTPTTTEFTSVVTSPSE